MKELCMAIVFGVMLIAVLSQIKKECIKYVRRRGAKTI